MVNNSTNINKTDNHLLPEITQYKEDNHIWHRGLGQAQQYGRVKPGNGILTLPLLMIGSPMVML